MTELSWTEAFQQLMTQAAHHRGTSRDAVQADADDPGHSWPRTRGADVLAIAAIVDPVVRALPTEPGSYGIARRWRHCVVELASFALDTPADEYAQNQTFWPTLAATMAHLAHREALVPHRQWRALLAEIARPDVDAPPDDESYLHFSADSYDELWRQQKTTLAKLRGARVREPSTGTHGRPTIVPQTTNRDALQLAAFWTLALHKAKHSSRQLVPELAAVLGIEGVTRRWHAAMADVETHARIGHPGDVYAHNAELWRATAAVAVTIALIDDMPLRFDLVLRDLGAKPRNVRTFDLKETSFDQTWTVLHDQLARARGSDASASGPDASADILVPRTTNADVRLLAAYWDAAWRELDDAWNRGAVTNPTTDEIQLPQVRERWEAALADVAAAATSTPGNVYAKNHDFWQASRAVTDTLDALHRLPPRTQLTFEVPADLWTRITGGIAGVARSVSGSVSDAIGSVARVVNHVSDDAGGPAIDGFLQRFKTPLLIGGGALGALAVYFLFRSPPRLEAPHEAA